jgi:hypothetical protein
MSESLQTEAETHLAERQSNQNLVPSFIYFHAALSVSHKVSIGQTRNKQIDR